MVLFRELVAARAWLAVIHHLAGACVGCMLAFMVAAVAGGVVGLPLALVGLPVLGLGLRITGWLARLERTRFAVTLGEPVPDWPAGSRAGYWLLAVPRRATLTERATWREVGYAALRLPVSAAALVLSLGTGTLGLVLLTLPLYDGALPDGGAHVAGTVLRGAPAMAASVAGGLLLLLAALCPVPVEVDVDVPVRPKPAVEATAYFVVAEALTNVAKHSRASQARVVVEQHGYPGTLSVVISDDGIGGADSGGAGLRGLADRVTGVDGRLSVESPPGGPTIIAAEFPC